MDTLVKVSLLLAVAVIFPVMVALGIEAFMPGPEVDYAECYTQRPVKEDEALSDEELDALYQERSDDENACRDRLDALKQPHEARVFAITSIVGFVAIAVGALKFADMTGPAGPGLVIGGMITIMYGSMRTFNTVDKRWLFIVALVTLVGVVWVSRRWFQGKGK